MVSLGALIKEVKLVSTLLLMAIAGYLVGSIGVPMFATKGRDAKELHPASGRSRRSQNDKIPPSTLKSEDTIETLLEVPVTELYDRLALWLLDASGDEIQEFWNHYLKRTDQSDDLSRLIFLGWTRTNPDAALLAVEGTRFAGMAWWAWACHDPERALEEVLKRTEGSDDEKLLRNVAIGIGEFHPSWLHQHFDDLPGKLIRDYAFEGYIQRAHTDDPQASIAFLKEHGLSINPRTILALGYQDPLAAQNLFSELTNEGQFNSYDMLFDELIDSLVDEDPALLDSLVANTNSPAQKMNLRRKQFEARIADDPAKSEKATLEMPDSWLKQDQLAALGNYYLKSDPDRALDLAARLLNESKNGLERYTWIYDADGTASGSGVANSLTNGFIREIMRTNPIELMSQIQPEEERQDRIMSESFFKAADIWADMDFGGFSDWAGDQADPAVYRQSGLIMISRHLERREYRQATIWARDLSADTAMGTDYFQDAYGQWMQNDPAAARAWRTEETLEEALGEVATEIEGIHQ